jgi:hypothetical protein
VTDRGHERGRVTYTVGIIGGISQWLARAHDCNGFLTQVMSDGSVRSIVVVSLPDGRLAGAQRGSLTLGWRPKGYYIINPSLTGQRNGEITTSFDHVFVHALLDRTSVYRLITPSILFLCNAWVSEAQNSLWLEKEVARIGLRRVQARQRRSIRSPCWIVMFFFYDFLTGTCRSFPLERFQAPREKESFVIDSVFIPITDSQTQEADAVQLRFFSSNQYC